MSQHLPVDSDVAQQLERRTSCWRSRNPPKSAVWKQIRDNFTEQLSGSDYLAMLHDILCAMCPVHVFHTANHSLIYVYADLAVIEIMREYNITRCMPWPDPFSISSMNSQDAQDWLKTYKQQLSWHDL